MKSTLPVPGSRETSLSPEIGSSRPRRVYKQTLLLLYFPYPEAFVTQFCRNLLFVYKKVYKQPALFPSLNLTPEGVNPMEFEMRNWLFCRWVDVNFLTTAHRAEGGFTTITMIPTALFGMFAGEILTGQASQRRKAANLVLFALGLLVAGLLMAFAFGSCSLPISNS